jgi:2-oxoglutarate dehydrogenase E1 component
MVLLENGRGGEMATKLKKAVETAVMTNGRAATFDVFRRWGYLQTQLDPLGQYLPPEPFPVALPEGEEDAAAEARAFYCGTIGIEYMHIANAEKREWLEAQMEREAPPVDQKKVLTGLIKAEIFEQVIQSRYLGTKRFSLEGLTVLIPFLERTLEVSAGCGVTTARSSPSLKMWTRARRWAGAM